MPLKMFEVVSPFPFLIDIKSLVRRSCTFCLIQETCNENYTQLCCAKFESVLLLSVGVEPCSF